MSNANSPDPTRNHPDKIASNNKVIVLSMKNMPSLANFKFDPSKNFMANNNTSSDNGQQVFSFKPQQLLPSTSTQNTIVQQKIQPIPPTSPVMASKIPSSSGTILIRAQSTPTVSKTQFTSLSSCPNMKIQEVAKITNVNKEPAPQSITAFRSKSTSDVAKPGHTLLLPSSALKSTAVITTTIPSGVKSMTFTQLPPALTTQLPKLSVTSKIPTSPLKSPPPAVKQIPIRPKVDATPQPNIIVQGSPQQQRTVLTIPTTFARFNAATQKWVLPPSTPFTSAVPPLARIQPKPVKVVEKVIVEARVETKNKDVEEVPVTEERTPEKAKRSSQEERLLEVRRIIEGDPKGDSKEIKPTDIIEEFQELSTEESSQVADSSSSLLLCDEKIENVSPEVTPSESEKSKEDPNTPKVVEEAKEENAASTSVNEVRKNLNLTLSEECDKENVEIIIEEDSVGSDESAVNEAKRRKLLDYEESLTRTEITKTAGEPNASSLGNSSKPKRIRKPKNPTIIATLGLPYKPPQPSVRKSKVEKKLEFELDFHDPLNKIQWDDGIGGLNNCNKLFGFDEFGLIEVISKRDALAKLKHLEPSIKDSPSIKLRKIVDPKDHFVCSVCAKMGTIRDFYSPECCSESCLAITKRKGSDAASFGKESSSESGITTPVDERKMMFGGEMIPLQQLQQQLLEQQVPASKRQFKTKVLSTIPETRFQWDTYLSEKSIPAPLSLFKSPYPKTENPFKVGMRVEAIDPENQNLFCVCTVEEKLGYRVKLHFDGYPPLYDFWVNADSPNIFPAGFCQSTNRTLQTPPRWSAKKFDWSEYLDYTNSIGAQRGMFPRMSKASEVVDNPFEVGMKLEVQRDQKIFAASIVDVLENRVLVAIDGYPPLGCRWIDIFSPHLHPCNFHKTITNQENFVPPFKPFEWSEYLKSTATKEAPTEFLFFRTRSAYNFEPGVKVEVVDPVNRQLIRPATVLRSENFKVQVIFDGFDIAFAFWMDDDSPDIHPINWCEKTGHPIEHPAGFNKSLENGLCPSAGCRGIGNGSHNDRYFHDNVEECPYNVKNWEKLVNHKKKSRFDTKHVNKRVPKPINRDIPMSNGSRHEPNVKKKLNEVKVEERVDFNANLDDESTEASSGVSKRGRKRKVEPATDTQPQNVKVFKTFLEDYGPQLNYSYNLWKENSRIFKRAEIDDFSTKNPTEWSCQNVATFIGKFVDDPEVIAKFREQEVDGAALICLCQDDLINLMNIKSGPAIKIYNRILHLRDVVMTKFMKI